MKGYSKVKMYFNKNDKDADEMRKLNKRKRLPSVECIPHFYLYLMFKYFGTTYEFVSPDFFHLI